MTRHIDRESQPVSESTTWEPCPPGMLADCSSRWQSSLRQQQRRQHSRLAVGVLASCCLLGLGWYSGWGQAISNPQTPQPVVRNLSCSEVLPVVDSYLAKDMPAEQQQQIAQHLHRCDHCQDLYRRRAAELGVRLVGWVSTSLGQQLALNLKTL